MDVNIGKLCMCEETDIESVLAAMNTTALVFERRPAKKFQAPRDLNPTITWSLHVPAISIYRDKAPLSVASLMQCSKEPNLLENFKAREQLYSHKENDYPLLAKVLYVLGGVLSILSVT